MGENQWAKKAAQAHSNLNLFASIVTLLEGGHLYDGANEAAPKIINICKKETARQLRAYDAAMRKIQP